MEERKLGKFKLSQWKENPLNPKIDSEVLLVQWYDSHKFDLQL